MFKRFKIIYILTAILSAIGSILAIVKAIYVIANGLVEYGITNDVASNNPILLFMIALAFAVGTFICIIAYKNEKKFEDIVANLQKNVANEKNEKDVSDKDSKSKP